MPLFLLPSKVARKMILYIIRSKILISGMGQHVCYSDSWEYKVINCDAIKRNESYVGHYQIAVLKFPFVKQSKSFVLLKTPSKSDLRFQRYRQFCPAENNKIQKKIVNNKQMHLEINIPDVRTTHSTWLPHSLWLIKKSYFPNVVPFILACNCPHIALSISWREVITRANHASLEIRTACGCHISILD